MSYHRRSSGFVEGRFSFGNAGSGNNGPNGPPHRDGHNGGPSQRGNGSNGDHRPSFYNHNSGYHGHNGPRERAHVTTVVPSQGNLPESKHLRGSENYGEWCFLMTALLKGVGLWGIIDASDNSPEKEGRAFLKLCMNITCVVTNSLYGITNAKGIWDKLKALYAETGLTRR